jgi:hypothetical protein
LVFTRVPAVASINNWTRRCAQDINASTEPVGKPPLDQFDSNPGKKICSGKDNCKFILMHREPDYFYLMIGLLSAVITAAAPLGPLAILGGFIAVLSLLMTAYGLIERRRHPWRAS